MEILRFAQNDKDVSDLPEKKHKMKILTHFSQLLIISFSVIAVKKHYYTYLIIIYIML